MSHVQFRILIWRCKFWCTIGHWALNKNYWRLAVKCMKESSDILIYIDRHYRWGESQA